MWVQPPFPQPWPAACSLAAIRDRSPRRALLPLRLAPPATRREATERLSIGHRLCRRALNPVDEEMVMGLQLRRFQVVTLTEAAAERVRDIVARSEKPILGVRVGVKNGGCAGMAYTVDVADTVKPGDDVVEDKGATVLVDPKAVLFLLGTRMDYRTDKFAS